MYSAIEEKEANKRYREGIIRSLLEDSEKGNIDIFEIVYEKREDPKEKRLIIKWN